MKISGRTTNLISKFEGGGADPHPLQMLTHWLKKADAVDS